MSALLSMSPASLAPQLPIDGDAENTRWVVYVGEDASSKNPKLQHFLPPLWHHHTPIHTSQPKPNSQPLATTPCHTATSMDPQDAKPTPTNYETK